MNHFTPEELWYMADGLFLIKKQCDMPDEIKIKLSSLLERLENMIDRYCLHQESEANHNYEVSKCKICGELFI